MKELKEIRFNETDILLQDNLVRGSILPETVAELNRNIIFKGDTVVEGPVYGHRLEIQQGSLEIQGAVFAQFELYVNSEAGGNITFKKSVGSANTIVSRASNCRLVFHSDINAKSVSLCNAFVAGSVYADEVELVNCVVIGGVFATQSVDLTNSIVGTFNTPSIKVSGIVHLLLPSAFSVEKMVAAAGTRLYNLCLADLGALYKGFPESANSGKIAIDVDADEVTTKLSDDQVQKTLRSYTVIGKVLAAAKPHWSDERRNLFTFAFLPFLHGVYPYVFHSEKQLAAMEEAGVTQPPLTTYGVSRALALKLLSDREA